MRVELACFFEVRTFYPVSSTSHMRSSTCQHTVATVELLNVVFCSGLRQVGGCRRVTVGGCSFYSAGYCRLCRRLPISVLSVDLFGRILTVNKASMAITGRGLTDHVFLAIPGISGNLIIGNGPTSSVSLCDW